jgi:hypothetical protein
MKCKKKEERQRKNYLENCLKQKGGKKEMKCREKDAGENEME